MITRVNKQPTGTGPVRCRGEQAEDRRRRGVRGGRPEPSRGRDYAAGWGAAITLERAPESDFRRCLIRSEGFYLSDNMPQIRTAHCYFLLVGRLGFGYTSRNVQQDKFKPRGDKGRADFSLCSGFIGWRGNHYFFRVRISRSPLADERRGPHITLIA